MLCPICYLVRFAGNALEKCFRKGGLKNFYGVNQRRAKISKIKEKTKNLENFCIFQGYPLWSIFLDSKSDTTYALMRT